LPALRRSTQALDEKGREITRTSIDLHVVGPYAAEAGRRFDRQMDQLFRDSIAAHGLDATITVSERRIPHRERVTLALEHGGGAGEIQLQGVWTIVCGGIPIGMTDFDLIPLGP
jgi:hypothetical protein